MTKQEPPMLTIETVMPGVFVTVSFTDGSNKNYTVQDDPIILPTEEVEYLETFDYVRKTINLMYLAEDTYWIIEDKSKPAYMQLSS